jgi:flagellin-like hook-associated protein FlgL
MVQPVLSSAIRANLTSLQGTAELLGRTQERLATGLRVNSALDDPTAFFAAKGLNDRAGDLGTRLDRLGQDVSTVKAATQAIETIENLLNTAKAKVVEAAALDSADTAGRAARQTDVNNLLAEARKVAEDAGYGGVNLLGGNNLTSTFNEDGTNTLTTTGVNYTTATSGITADFATGFTDATETTAATTALNTALTTVRSQASAFGTNLTIIETRQDFAEKIIGTLEEGAGKLTLADLQEESANLLALQTRQTLGIQALSLSNQTEQSILRLF